MDVQPNVHTDTVIKAFLRSELQLIRSQKNSSVCCLVISRRTTAITGEPAEAFFHPATDARLNRISCQKPGHVAC